MRTRTTLFMAAAMCASASILHAAEDAEASAYAQTERTVKKAVRTQKQSAAADFFIAYEDSSGHLLVIYTNGFGGYKESFFWGTWETLDQLDVTMEGKAEYKGRWGWAYTFMKNGSLGYNSGRGPGVVYHRNQRMIVCEDGNKTIALKKLSGSKERRLADEIGGGRARLRFLPRQPLFLARVADSGGGEEIVYVERRFNGSDLRVGIGTRKNLSYYRASGGMNGETFKYYPAIDKTGEITTGGTLRLRRSESAPYEALHRLSLTEAADVVQDPATLTRELHTPCGTGRISESF